MILRNFDRRYLLWLTLFVIKLTWVNTICLILFLLFFHLFILTLQLTRSDWLEVQRWNLDFESFRWTLVRNLNVDLCYLWNFFNLVRGARLASRLRLMRWWNLLIFDCRLSLFICKDLFYFLEWCYWIILLCWTLGRGTGVGITIFLAHFISAFTFHHLIDHVFGLLRARYGRD